MIVAIKLTTTKWNTGMMIIKYTLYWLMLAGIVTTSTILGVLLSFLWLKYVQTTAGVDVFSILKLKR